MAEIRERYQGRAEGLANGLEVGVEGKRETEHDPYVLGWNNGVDGGTICREERMRKGKVLSLCMSYGGIRVGEEGDFVSLFCP